MSRNWVVLCVALFVVEFAIGESANGLTYPFTVSGTTYTVVEPDPFFNGGSPGNTVRTTNPGQFWAQNGATNVDGLWRSRDFNSLNLNAPAPASAPDLVEISGQDVMPPDLRTTITGLPNNSYDVYLLMMVQASNPSNPIQPATLGADLDVGQNAPTTLRGPRTQSGIILTNIIITPDNPGYEVALAPLGSVTGTQIGVVVGPLWAGDLNHDGTNNQDDLDIVLSHMGQFVTPGDRSMGDTDGNGFIDANDAKNVYYEAWGEKGYPPGRRGDYIGIAYKPSGSGSGVSSLGVPEPASVALAIAGVTIAVGFSARRRRRYATIAIVAALAVACGSLSAMAQINGSFVPVTTEAGQSPPSGYVSQDLSVNATSDWLATELRIVLTSGTIYQDNGAGIPSPNYKGPDPSNFSAIPTLRWDTYVTGSGGLAEAAPMSAGGAIDIGGLGSFPNGGQFDTAGINLEWFTLSTTDVGTFTLGRFTLASTAQGTWQMRLDSLGQSSPYLLSGTVQNGVLLAAASLPGDYNGNGKVDAADYVLWRKTPTGFGGNPAGYNTWRSNYGNSSGSGSSLVSGSAVPEPTVLSMIVIALGTILFPRRM